MSDNLPKINSTDCIITFEDEYHTMDITSPDPKSIRFTCYDPDNLVSFNIDPRDLLEWLIKSAHIKLSAAALIGLVDMNDYVVTIDPADNTETNKEDE